MRIACVYLPSFVLQAHVRQTPFRAGRPFAIVRRGQKGGQGDLNSKRDILALSKAAWQLGVRAGMNGTRVRTVAPATELISEDPTLYRQSLEALGESLLNLSLTVDIESGLQAIAPECLSSQGVGSQGVGSQGVGSQDVGSQDVGSQGVSSYVAIYLRVPKHSRGDSFGNKILSQLDRQGYRARVGVADNRFTAWVAARGIDGKQAQNTQRELFSDDCRTIPKGGSAAFLAPKSIDLLGLDSDIQNMLASRGITTLGDFAKLPPPSHVGSRQRLHTQTIDFRSLAHGEGPTFLHGFAPQQNIVEGIEFEGEVLDTQALAFSLRPLADRTCDRLQGRSMAAQEVVLRLYSCDERSTEIVIDPLDATLDGPRLFKLLHASLEEVERSHPVIGIELTVTNECEPALEEATLVESQGELASDRSLDIAISRLQSIVNRKPAHAKSDVAPAQQSFQLMGWAGAPMPSRSGERFRSRSATRPQSFAEPAQQVLLPL